MNWLIIIAPHEGASETNPTRRIGSACASNPARRSGFIICPVDAALSRKHIFTQKHDPANTFSLKSHIPQTRFSLKAVSRKPFLFQNPIPQILFPANPYPAQE